MKIGKRQQKISPLKSQNRHIKFVQPTFHLNVTAENIYFPLCKRDVYSKSVLNSSFEFMLFYSAVFDLFSSQE